MGDKVALLSVSILCLTTLLGILGPLLKGWQARKDAERDLDIKLEGNPSMLTRVIDLERDHVRRWTEHDKACDKRDQERQRWTEARDREFERRLSEFRESIRKMGDRQSDMGNEQLKRLDDHSRRLELFLVEQAQQKEQIKNLYNFLDRREAATARFRDGPTGGDGRA